MGLPWDKKMSHWLCKYHAFMPKYCTLVLSWLRTTFGATCHSNTEAATFHSIIYEVSAVTYVTYHMWGLLNRKKHLISQSCYFFLYHTWLQTWINSMFPDLPFVLGVQMDFAISNLNRPWQMELIHAVLWTDCAISSSAAIAFVFWQFHRLNCHVIK